MSVCNNIFKRKKVNTSKLIPFGFKEHNENYYYSKQIMNNEFTVEVIIFKNGEVKARVIENDFNEEYSKADNENILGDYVSKVREEYESVLKNIADNCFIEKIFITDQANRINNYIVDKYSSKSEFLFSDYSGCAIYRNSNGKWFSLITNIDKSKIVKNAFGEIEIINLKRMDDIDYKNAYPAWHMNKKSWITIILDESLSDVEIEKYIDYSFKAVMNSK